MNQQIINWYFSNRLVAVPTAASAKRPIGRWKNIRTIDDAHNAWDHAEPNARVGILTEPSRLLVVDLDQKGNVDGVASLREWIATGLDVSQGTAADLIDDFPVQCRTPSGGRHLYFQLPDGLNWYDEATTRSNVIPGVDLRGRGGFVVAPPSRYDGKPYQWTNRWSQRAEIPDVQPWLEKLIRHNKTEPRRRQRTQRQKTPSPDAYDVEKAANVYLEKALQTAVIGNRNDTGFQLAIQLRDLGQPKSNTVSYLEEFAGQVPQPRGKGQNWYTIQEAHQTVDVVYRQPPREPAVPKEAFTKPPQSRRPEPPPPEPPANLAPKLSVVSEPETSDNPSLDGPPDNSPNPDEPIALREEQERRFLAFLERSDYGNATAFAHLHGDRFRYGRTRDKWFEWTGHYWRVCPGSTPEQAFVDTMQKRATAASVFDDDTVRKKAINFATASKNTAKTDSGLRAATRLPELEWPTDVELDSDPDLLACPNGVVNLTTGELQPGKQEQLITRSSPVHYDPEATCPRWTRFLDEIFDGDQELIEFIQRACGYSVTGHVSEQVVFLCHGQGANGKSVMLATLQAIMGDLAAQTPFSTFEQTLGDRQTNDLAALRGRRLVIAAEAQQNKRLDEARVKAVTGGDPVTARFLYGEYFTYDPTYKIWLALNHKPTVRGNDDGIWRRIRLIPFMQQFHGDDADPDLQKKLLAESQGILRWIAEGTRMWRERTLDPPEVVLDATADYRKESDILGEFIEQRTVAAPSFSAKAADLFRTYKEWAEDNGHRYILNSTKFGRELADRGLNKQRSGGYIRYLGIGLRSRVDVEFDSEQIGEDDDKDLF